MNKKDVNKVIEIAESLDFSVGYNNKWFTFSKFSPAGQDFNIEIQADTLEELYENLKDYYEYYDPSEETVLWLDDTGHGKNGAPYDMRDVLKDMEACEEFIRELVTEIQNIVD